MKVVGFELQTLAVAGVCLANWLTTTTANCLRAVVVAQLAEQLLPTPEIHDLNVDISEILLAQFYLSIVQ